MYVVPVYVGHDDLWCFVMYVRRLYHVFSIQEEWKNTGGISKPAHWTRFDVRRVKYFHA